jgi:hypothetical protein
MKNSLLLIFNKSKLLYIPFGVFLLCILGSIKVSHAADASKYICTDNSFGNVTVSFPQKITTDDSSIFLTLQNNRYDKDKNPIDETVTIAIDPEGDLKTKVAVFNDGLTLKQVEIDKNSSISVEIQLNNEEYLNGIPIQFSLFNGTTCNPKLSLVVLGKTAAASTCGGQNLLNFDSIVKDTDGSILLTVSGCLTNLYDNNSIDIKKDQTPVVTITASDSAVKADGTFTKVINFGVLKSDTTAIASTFKDSMDHFINSLDIKIASITSSTPSFAGCDGITDTEERESCENCVWKDKAAFEPTGSVWTEIGCVDPSPAGLITRAFQIGVGIMGGVAVVRIIQIAIIMQGDDAQKKQEAPAMIWGLAGGLLFLAVGLLVLKYLGINVIGLPENFLGR